MPEIQVQGSSSKRSRSKPNVPRSEEAAEKQAEARVHRLRKNNPRPVESCRREKHHTPTSDPASGLHRKGHRSQKQQSAVPSRFPVEKQETIPRQLLTQDCRGGSSHQRSPKRRRQSQNGDSAQVDGRKRHHQNELPGEDPRTPRRRLRKHKSKKPRPTAAHLYATAAQLKRARQHSVKQRRRARQHKRRAIHTFAPIARSWD